MALTLNLDGIKPLLGALGLGQDEPKPAGVDATPAPPPAPVVLPPTPAAAGFSAWAADPKNAQKVAAGVTPPGSPLLPPPPQPFYGSVAPPPPSLPSSPAGLKSPGNINVYDRPIVRNPDGSSSTVRSMSFGTDKGETLVPTVSDGADGRSPHVMGNREAEAYYARTGQSLGTFDTPDNATAYAQALHLQQAGMGSQGGRTSVLPRIQQQPAPTAPPLASAQMPSSPPPLGANIPLPPGAAQMASVNPPKPPAPAFLTPPTPTDPAAAYKANMASDMAANPDQYQKPNLVGQGWKKALLFGIPAALQSAGSGLSNMGRGNPTAGMGLINDQVAHDRGVPAANAAIYNQRNVQPLKDALAMKDTQSQIGQRDAAAQLSGAKANAVPDAIKQKQQVTLAQLAKTGQKGAYDADGNLTIEDDPTSEAFKSRQVLDSVRQSKQDLQDAQTAFTKAKGDPNSPLFQQTQARLKIAQQNAAAAQTRATAYMGNYLKGAYNTGNDGQTLPGAPTIANDNGQQTVVGATNAGSATKANSNAAQFNDVHGALDSLEGAADALVNKGGKLNSPGVAAALSQPAGTLGQWLQGEGVKANLTPEERDYVTAVAAAHENVQALRKSAGGTATDSAVSKLDALIPGISTPDIDYLKRQTGQIRSTAERLGKGATTASGGLSVRGQQKGGITPAPTSAPPASETLPPQAASQLQEGMQHTFNNGQTWTKQGRKSVRIK